MFRRATSLTARHLAARGPLARPRTRLLLPAVASKSDMPAPPTHTSGEGRLTGVGMLPLDDLHALPHDFHHLSNELLFHLVGAGVVGPNTRPKPKPQFLWPTKPPSHLTPNESRPLGAWLSFRPRTTCTAPAASV